VANPLKNANTQAHDGVYLVVLAHLQKRKKLELKRINSTKKQRRNESLEVTGRWLREHQRVRSVTAINGAKVVWPRSVSAEEQTLRTRLGLNTIQHPVTLMWRCAVWSERTEHWPASGRGAPDASDRVLEARRALCC
jgi:hypothetical protein